MHADDLSQPDCLVVTHSEELVAEAHSLCSQLESTMQDTMKEKDQSLMVTPSGAPALPGPSSAEKQGKPVLTSVSYSLGIYLRPPGKLCIVIMTIIACYRHIIYVILLNLPL